MPSVHRHVYQLEFLQFKEKPDGDDKCERSKHQQVVFRLAGGRRPVLCHGCVAIVPVGKRSIGHHKSDHLAIATRVVWPFLFLVWTQWFANPEFDDVVWQTGMLHSEDVRLDRLKCSSWV